MTVLFRIGLALILVALVALLSSGPPLAIQQQDVTATLASGSAFVYQFLLQEVGFARITLSVLGLLVLLIPFRSKQLWAWLALLLFLLLYFVPVFFAPLIGFYPEWQDLREGVAHPGMARHALFRLLFTLSFLTGLALCLPAFLGQRRG